MGDELKELEEYVNKQRDKLGEEIIEDVDGGVVPETIIGARYAFTLMQMKIREIAAEAGDGGE